MGLLNTSILVPVALVVGYSIYSAICLLRNYLVARAIGVPVRIIIVDHINPLWILVSQPVVSLLKLLPYGLGDNNITRFNYLGWEYNVRWAAHNEMGDIFMLCSPSRIWLYLGTPELVTAVLKRPNDFTHDSRLTAPLECFGPNIATATGRRWQKMRKLIGSCFTDGNHTIVWQETISQATDMSLYWLSQTSVDTVAHDTRTLFLNVMSRAGFGKSYPFKGYREPQLMLPGTTLSYKEALQTILENSIVIMMLGTRVLSKPWLPAPLRRLHDACAAFQGYLEELYNYEKDSAPKRLSDQNLMTSLVRASQEETTEGLDEHEIYGNMFLFNVGGHDTTTHTFVWVVYFLAAHPEVQEWIHEEILHVLGDRAISEWSYTTDFPRLKRCLCVLLETLRHYSPVGVAKWTDGRTATLEYGTKKLTIPPKTMILPSHACVQTDPKHWGRDSMEWKPSRWITNPGASLDDE